MITPILIPKRQRRHKPRQTPTVPNLLSGTLAVNAVLTLVFDQAMAVTRFSPAQITVTDPGTGTLVATGLVSITGTQVVINVTPVGQAKRHVQAEKPMLTATATSGLVASAGGLPWAGVSGFVLVID